MTFVHSRGLAHHADGLLICPTEKLQFFPMPPAQAVGSRCMGLAFPVQKSLTQVFKGQVGEGALFGCSPPADGAAARNAAFPKALQAALAETVAAWQKDGILEDFTAHGTGKVLHGEICRHVLVQVLPFLPLLCV